MADPTQAQREKAEKLAPCNCGFDEDTSPKWSKHAEDCLYWMQEGIAEALADERAAVLAELETEIASLRLAQSGSGGNVTIAVLTAVNAKLNAALKALHDDCAEYISINKLSGAFDNQVMRQAREALAAYDAEKKP